MAAKLRKLLSHAGLGQDQHDVVPMHHIYCASKRSSGIGNQKTRGLRNDRTLINIAEYISQGLKAPQEGEIEIAEGITFEHVARSQFLRFRQILNVTEDGYNSALSSLSGGSTQDSGKSGSLFWFSSDKQFVMKSVSESEIDALSDMLPRYIEHFAGSQAAGLPCFISRFYGAYRLQIDTLRMHMVVMNNVFGGSDLPPRIYDLKGTTEDRYVVPEPGKVMKDLNFNGHSMCISAAAVVNRAIQADTEFLRGENIMDYSLLVGVSEDSGQNAPKRSESNTYNGLEFTGEDDDEEEDVILYEARQATFSFGIIDVLVKYKLKKILAHWLKKPTIGCFNEIDTEPPDYYQDRFVDYFQTKIQNSSPM